VAAAADALKPLKRTTSGSRLDAREVVVVGDMLKRRKGRWLWWETCRNSEKKPPPARVWMRGRWLWWETCRNVEMDHLRLAFGCEGGGCNGRHVETAKWTTSGSRLDAREVVVVGDLSKRRKKNHLRLAFGCEGGGCGGRHVETSKWTTSGSRLDAREVVVMGDMSKRRKKNHLWLAFGCEGGGGGSRVKTMKITTSGSHLDAREVVVGVVSKRRK